MVPKKGCSFFKKEIFMKVIIHDLSEGTAFSPKKPDKDSVVIHANNQYAPCRGCFQCWLKNAGFCTMKDSLQHIGALIGQSDPLIIVSRCCYGGYSSPVKAILDRAIGVSLPFFTWRGGQTHHISRYARRKLLRVCFYGECSELERETAREVVERNRLNLDYEKADVIFFETIGQLQEADL